MLEVPLMLAGVPLMLAGVPLMLEVPLMLVVEWLFRKGGWAALTQRRPG